MEYDTMEFKQSGITLMSQKKPHKIDYWERYKTNTQGYRHYIDTVIRYIPRGSHMVLDLGCKDGLVASMLAYNRDSIVHGLDPDQENINKAQDICTRRLLACVFEMQRLNIVKPERKYDHAICLDVLEEIPTYRNIFKIMRENVTNFTVLTAIDPKYHRRTTNAPRRMLRQDKLEKLFKQHKLDYKLLEHRRRQCGGDFVYKLWNPKNKQRKPRKVVIRR